MVTMEKVDSHMAETSQVARCILSVTAASTSSERAIFTAGRSLDERRTQLSGDNVDGLLFIHGLLKKKNLHQPCRTALIAVSHCHDINLLF
jgi:hypothetical protein